MKIFTTSDWHFGIYPANLEKWLGMMEDYFHNYFIPYIKSNSENGDILIICGDIYDNRTSIPIIISCAVENILISLSKILPVHIIVGNRDLYNKGSNDINSLRLFNHVNNISVYTKTTTIDFFGEKIVIMPWIEKRLDIINELKSNRGDYLFCHSDLKDCITHSNSSSNKNPDKIDISFFKDYKKVFSGHIHIRQIIDNFIFIGSPYQMHRSEMGSDKGITILDVSDGSVKFDSDKYSPVFGKIFIKTEDDILNLKELKDSKDYIDLHISNSLIKNRKIRRKLEIIIEKIKFSSIEYINDIVDDISSDVVDDNKEISNIGGFDISIQLDYEEYIREYINNQNYDNKLKFGILSEYNDIIKIYNENYKN